jgi:hypothetical protein
MEFWATARAQRSKVDVLHSFLLMISRRSWAYSSMIRRASSNREGWGYKACSSAGGSSDWLMVERFKTSPKGR